MSNLAKSRKTLVAGEALENYRLVAIIAGKASYCEEGFLPAGGTLTYAEEDAPVSVQLMNADGTLEIEATGAVTMGNEAALDTDGKIKADPGAGARTVVGMFMASLTAGGVVEIMPYPRPVIYSE